MAVVGRDLIQIVAVLAFIGLFGGGTILGLSEMEQATNNSDATQFLTDTINAYDVIPDMLRVVVVFGFIAVLISLLWFAIARTGMLGMGGRGGL